MNLDEEDLLKVSFKNIDWFQICPFSKIIPFSKKSPKNQQILKNSNFFFCFSGGNFIGLFNGILFVFILSVVVDIQKEVSEFYCRKISSGRHCILPHLAHIWIVCIYILSITSNMYVYEIITANRGWCSTGDGSQRSTTEFISISRN